MIAANPHFPVLTALVLVPAVAAVLVALLSNRRPEWVKITALLSSVVTAGLSIWLLAAFDRHDPGFQLVSKHPWIPAWGISWHLGVDGISLFLVVLTGVLFPLVIAGTDPHHDQKRYLSWMLLLEAGVMGSFISLDLFLFFVFFEIVLVPMYFLIGGWGYDNRIYAATKFFLFTMVGSAFMLVGIVATAFLAKSNGVGHVTFDLVEIAEKSTFAASTGRWLFFAFAVAFAVKVPLFPLHTWLPDAHTQAPTGGSVILAAVMLKLGTYGLLRYGVFLFPEAARWSSPLFFTLAVIGIIYGAIAATMQKDLNRVVAYSSVAHLGFIVLGTFALTTQSVNGGILQMVNHGVSTGALFLLVGMISDRRHTREIAKLRGIQHVAPIFAAAFTVVMLSSIGVPGLNGFIGEYLVLIGSFLTARWWTVVATAGVILAALYLLWAYQRVFHGEPDEDNKHFKELTWKEGMTLMPLIGLIVFVGVYPKPILDRMGPSVKALITHVSEKTGYVEPQPTQKVAEAEGGRVMLGTLVGPSIDWFALSPFLVLLGAAMVLLVVAALTPAWPRNAYSSFTVLAAIAAIVLSIILWRRVSVHGSTTLVGASLKLDHFSLWVTITICLAVAMASLITSDYLRREGGDGPEVYALYLLSAVGGLVMGAANDLVVLFLGLEILSIAMYVMTASHRRRTKSGEAGIKYFVLGGFSSAFFLYGVALIYGSSGSTNLDTIRDTFNSSSPLGRHDALMLAGIALLIVGLGFKVAAVPFHFWSPDVYEGAPTPVTSFLAAVGKAAAFAAMLRVLIFALPQWRDDYRPAVWAIGVLTLVVGAVMAVVQTNVKRMLAFSSINHAGFILVGVEAAAHTAGASAGTEGVPSALLYLLLYAALVTGTFAVVTLVGRTGDGHTDLATFRGLGRTRPVLALALTVLLLAQAGVPLTSGFIAKFGVIRAAVEEHSYAIAIIAMLAAVIAAYLYLRIMVSMWIADPEPSDAELEPVRVPWTTATAITIAVAFTLGVGMFPGWFIDTARSVVAAAPTR